MVPQSCLRCLHLFPCLLHLPLQIVKDQPLHVQAVVKPHIQCNAYFAEPGIMLTAMLEDPDPEVRQFGVNLIKKSRQSPPKPPKMKALKGMRKHNVPDLNWEAESWKDIINWKKITVWEPRILEKLTMQEIEDAVQTPISFPKYPCHSQTVERMFCLWRGEAEREDCGSSGKQEVKEGL